jgi:hypothetical protein
MVSKALKLGGPRKPPQGLLSAHRDFPTDIDGYPAPLTEHADAITQCEASWERKEVDGRFRLPKEVLLSV